MRQLQAHEFEIFIKTIGHSPQTVITTHHLQQSLCDVYLIGDADNFKAAIVQLTPYPFEPTAFGEDAQAMWRILTQMQNWEVINIDRDVADDLAYIMQNEIKTSIRQYGDVYYQLNHEIDYRPLQIDIDLRLLSLDDIDLVKNSTTPMQSLSFGTIQASLEHGIIAGAIIDNQIIAIADSRISDHYFDVGVFTNEHWRKKGLSTAVASLVIIEGQKRGLTPVWSVGADNIASHRVAEKLGFEKVSERVYLIPQKDKS